MYAEKGIKLDEAEDLIGKALALDPDNGAYVDSIGWVYYKRGMDDEALKALTRAAKLIGDDPVIREHLGDAYHGKRMWKEALAEWARAAALDPGNAAVQKKIEKLRACLGIPPEGRAAPVDPPREVVKE